MLTPEARLYAVEIDELDTHPGARKRYFLRDGTGTEVAVLSLGNARHYAAGVGTDYRYRRHAQVIDLPPDGALA